MGLSFFKKKLQFFVATFTRFLSLGFFKMVERRMVFFYIYVCALCFAYFVQVTKHGGLRLSNVSPPFFLDVCT